MFYPGAIVLSPNSPESWETLCRDFTTAQNAKDNMNKRSECYSEVVIQVELNGKIMNRRVSRFLCASVQFPRACNEIENRAKEHESFSHVNQWLQTISTVVFTDANVIEGCKADCYLKM
jgi:hypothetical protein